MDWFSEWDRGPFVEIDSVDPAVDTGRLTAWLILTVVALIVAVLWHRQRVSRHSLWCATAGRDVEVLFRLGHVLSCSTFEDPTAIACARRCLVRSFRVQWPPALPVATRLPAPRLSREVRLSFLSGASD
jgi:hypothetical protein